MFEQLINGNYLKQASLGSAFLVIAMLVMVIIPLPPLALDFLFSFNITVSLIILMVSVYVVRPLEFSLFPTVLLIATLLRLTLNIASTRVVLLHGHEGPQAAGEVIRAFGEVVIGGNFIVGLIVFVILMIINFIVVTKGAGRISEVSARFTLDAMPGKQMSIDADLNAGVITQDEAKKRRQDVIQESDFYGSMDGASKFVRGDAVAGLLILLINMIGGIIIGVFQNGMTLDSAVTTFSILTIGDGLVAQIPSLLLSIAAAIIVTRVSNEQDMSQQTLSQLFSNPKPLIVSAMILFSIALIPNMPHVPLMSFSLLVLLSVMYLNKKNEKSTALPASEGTQAEAVNTPMADIDWNDVVSIDRIALEIGYGLINLVGIKKDGQLIARIKGIRRKISQDLGFLIPTIHVKDNLNLPPNTYRIYLKGVVIAEATVYPDKLLAINPGHIKTPLHGIPGKDPTFDLDAYWITEEQRDYAQNAGYTIVDLSTVIATNINQVIRSNAAHILGYDEVQQLINRLTENEPRLAETLNSSANGIPLNIIFGILQKLLQSGIPILDFRTIAEKMVDSWSKSKDQEQLLDAVRVALKHLIVYSICGNQKELPVAVIDNELAQILLKSVQVNQSLGERMIILEPSLTEKIYTKLLEYVHKCELNSYPGILLLTNELRHLIEKLFKPNIPNLHFLSFAEIPEDKQLKIIERIG
ncbi:flagellar biosynthesis protein FlhA [Legionella nagasakiensis]|uniref:flagellar biosynthesis protein FlhA n=1 Tax=Legionella nagasakiensis TaxID=535290 RepID=UPI00105494A9|nr:flagellar biosynthesis protein FlhA [Legionella nagasakiensis]